MRIQPRLSIVHAEPVSAACLMGALRTHLCESRGGHQRGLGAQGPNLRDGRECQRAHDPPAPRARRAARIETPGQNQNRLRLAPRLSAMRIVCSVVRCSNHMGRFRRFSARVDIRSTEPGFRFRCIADLEIRQSRYPRRIKYVSMIHPCATRAAWRSALIRSLTSASGPAMQICCAIPR